MHIMSSFDTRFVKENDRILNFKFYVVVQRHT